MGVVTPGTTKDTMYWKILLICTSGLLASTYFAKELSGTYEFPPPDGLEGDAAIVQLTKGEEGQYFAQVTVADETIEGANVVVSETQFSFDIEVKTHEGDMLQVYTVSLEKGEYTLSIMTEQGDLSRSLSLKGTLVKEIEGTYSFQPQEGIKNSTTTIQLAKDDEGNFSVSVTVFDKTIEGTNIRVSKDQFSFDTEVKTQNGNKYQTWKVELEDDEAELTVLADVGIQTQSITLKGKRVDEENGSEI